MPNKNPNSNVSYGVPTYAQRPNGQSAKVPQGMPAYGGVGAYGQPGYGAAPAGGNGGDKKGASGKGGGREKKKRPISFYVAIIVAAVAIVVAGVFAWMMFSDQPKSSNRGGIIGQIEGKSTEEIQAELDRIIEEGMFNISIASAVEFEDGASEGEIKIENVPNNPYLMQVVITRNDNGEVIYTSDVLEPNYHIQSAKLDKDLDAGTYECTATFHALDKETEEEVGSAAAVMTIQVLH